MTFTIELLLKNISTKIKGTYLLTKNCIVPFLGQFCKDLGKTQYEKMQCWIPGVFNSD